MLDSEEEEDEVAGMKNKGWFSSIFQSIAGKANLEKSDLEPALKDRLRTKNVAEEIAEKLCESIAASLVGKKLASFTGVSSTVQAMKNALVRILIPERSIDVLRDVDAAKEQGGPYGITFVGVYGVGKFTNLAKIPYWLQKKDISVMMAACDTFKSGAVEQLRTHARKLQIPIFEKGYEKDPAIVAKQAIQEARRNSSDVVLDDTAGRMQGQVLKPESVLVNGTSESITAAAQELGWSCSFIILSSFLTLFPDFAVPADTTALIAEELSDGVEVHHHLNNEEERTLELMIPTPWEGVPSVSI
ncbi:hypothetical protein C5167_022567 [Papaver somniferum]|uniref:SRP54-type proteins GTP-binding domain-containing protein n=1 Tax=Papaver somniferum TaxID=3469 RepID=A0A4Y7JJ97_PAPSO|nr:hypothetical protein C5167_022567 [Papaver somniferum]